MTLAQAKTAQYQISPGEVHLWHAFIPNLVAKFSQRSLRSILSPQEVRRLNEFTLEGPQNEYLAARLMIRSVLSGYVPSIAPSAWHFSYNQHRKPNVTTKVQGLSLEFNISHSKNILVCAVSLGIPLGVDIEAETSQFDHLEMSKASFSKSESLELSRLSPIHISQRFFEYWTLKEAFIKAMGMGLSLPLEEFSFKIPDSKTAPIQIGFTAAIQESPTDWQFELLDIIPGYRLAIAAKTGPTRRITVVQMQEFGLSTATSVSA